MLETSLSQGGQDNDTTWLNTTTACVSAGYAGAQGTARAPRRNVSRVILSSCPVQIRRRSNTTIHLTKEWRLGWWHPADIDESSIDHVAERHEAKAMPEIAARSR